MNWLLLVLLILACYRVTRLLYQDDIFEPLRLWVWRGASRYSSSDLDLLPFRQRMPERFLHFSHALLTCPHCLSVWAAGTVIIIEVIPFVGSALIYLLAISGAVSLIWDAKERLEA